MSDLLATIAEAAKSGKLLKSSADNITAMLSRSDSPVYLAAISELVSAGNWKELDDRFFRTLVFGTGGLRGKTIGDTLTAAEQGMPQALGRPEYPCVGTNAMNYYNISRATQGLVAYVREHHSRSGGKGWPGICISCDTRFFSREFAQLAAKIISENGCDAYLFAAPRSTPELSFAVRYTNSTAGINITASHNPPAYNGYKVYFDDGAQIVEPHASAIIAKVTAIESETYEPLPAGEQGRVILIGEEIDEAYMKRLATLPLDAEVLRQAHDLKIVFTPLHGVGGVIIQPMLARLGLQCSVVAAQEGPDGRFPTVKSPNPESPDALAMAIDQANATGADLVMATDPDDDRLGVAARDEDSVMTLLTGNQIGSLLAWYRCMKHFETGILDDSNKDHAAVIKTFVTTDLQKAIAGKFGLRCVETLTGFKYIGQKLRKYEEAIPEALRRDYTGMSEEATRKLRLEHSTLYVFGGEESYGYSASDFVRDKDGNSAAVLVAEVAAYAKSQGTSLPGLLDRIFSEFGYYLERGEFLSMEGAEGAAKIAKLVKSYAEHPPMEVDGSKVISIRDFAREEIRDVEGDLIPKEAMLMITLADDRRVAVRPSGTEPKIKYYTFALRKPLGESRFTTEELREIRRDVASSLDSLWAWLKRDAASRC